MRWAWLGLAGTVATVGVVGAAALLFALFEPIFLYNDGWTPLPATDDPPAVFDLADATRTDDAARAEAVLRSAYTDGRHPALSAAVADDGRVLWRGAIGFASLETSEPATFETEFRLGSTSKAVTATALGTLLADGRLDLSTPMGRLDPTLAAPVRDVTVGQAASHRAGVRNYGTCLCFPVWEHLNRRPFASVRDSVGVIETDPLLFPPGGGFAYTSLGFNVAGLAVEAASGEAFDAYVARAVAAPLGLESLRVERFDEPGSTGFYDVEPRGYKRAYAVDHSIRVPSGGFRATPSDVARLGLAMTDERLLPRSVQEALLTVPPGGDDEDALAYAHGWRVGGWTVEGVGPLIHHNGTAVGSRSILAISREDGVVVSLMTNDGGDSVRDLTPVASDLLRAFVL